MKKKKNMKIIHKNYLSLQEKLYVRVALKKFGFDYFKNWVLSNKNLNDIEKENLLNYCERLGFN